MNKCMDCRILVVVGPRCRRCAHKAKPEKQCSICGAITKFDPCRKCSAAKRKRVPNYCKDCRKEIYPGSIRCKSCAGKHQNEYKEKKPCSTCGKLSIQNPCHSCMQKSNWYGNKQRKKAASEKSKTLWRDKAYREKVSNAISAAWDEERKEYYRELRKEFWTEERRQWQTKQNLERWADPEFRTKIDEINNSEEGKQRRANAAAKVQRRPRFSTYIELEVRHALKLRGIQFKFQYPLGGKVYDFYLPRIKTLIEVDGDYWHSLPENIKNDKIKDSIAENWGFTLIRITETAINLEGALNPIDRFVLPLVTEDLPPKIVEQRLF